jgi:hypothetical protein
MTPLDFATVANWWVPAMKARDVFLQEAQKACPHVFYQGVDTCSENAGTLPGDFTRKRCFE